MIGAYVFKIVTESSSKLARSTISFCLIQGNKPQHWSVQFSSFSSLGSKWSDTQYSGSCCSPLAVQAMYGTITVRQVHCLLSQAVAIENSLIVSQLSFW